MNLDEINAILDRLGTGFNEEFSRDKEGFREALKRGYAEKGKETSGSKANQTFGSNRTITMARELIGTQSDKPNIIDQIFKADPDQVAMRNRMGLGLSNDGATRAGQILGTLASDVVQDRGRSAWWLLNAPQAVGNVAQEAAIHKVAPGIYAADEQLDELSNAITTENKIAATRKGLIDSEGLPVAGVSVDRDGVYRKRRYGPGLAEALMIPAGAAINTSIGLMSPFGGQEGYKAVFESEEDPSKTSNVLGEVAAKYILGKTGNLLPWDEFKQVRPDVSKDEYMRYKAFKFDNDTDLNIFDDGQVVLPAGVLKYTDEGIHGPEVQFLGRSLPLHTGIMPTAAAILGTAYGAKMGDNFKGKDGKTYRRGIRGGMIGGSAAGLGAMTLGNIIEGERRRRNAEENNQYN